MSRVFGYTHQVPVKGLTTEQALAFMLAKFQGRDALRAGIERANKCVRARLDRYTALLEDVFMKPART